MVSGKCPHPWNKTKKGTFSKGHPQVNDGKGQFKKGEIHTPIALNRELGRVRYAQGIHPFNKINLDAMEMANKEDWYGIGKSKWKKLSKDILHRDRFICQSCGCSLKHNKPNVHHIVPFSISHDNREENLISLCIPCHASIEYFTRLQYQGGDING